MFSLDSLVYLPLAEATVITFLAPMVAAYASHILVKTPFTRPQQIGGAISIVGVVLISQPFSFVSSPSTTEASVYRNNNTVASNTTSSEYTGSHSGVTPAQHIMAVGVGLVGVCGAACAYTTISWIGKRAHPLIMVNYFATWCTFVSLCAVLFVPSFAFRMPATLKEWLLMLALGICGFVMQYLLTEGLAHEKSTRAFNMVYTQMLFALAFDKLVFDTQPNVISIVGSSLILGSAIWVAVKKDANASRRGVRIERSDEEEGLVEGMDTERERGRSREEERDHRELALRTVRV